MGRRGNCERGNCERGNCERGNKFLRCGRRRLMSAFAEQLHPTDREPTVIIALILYPRLLLTSFGSGVKGGYRALRPTAEDFNPTALNCHGS